MLPIVWRASAKVDLANIIAYIARANPAAARRMRKLLGDAVLPTSEYPYLHQLSERVPGTREIVVTPNYVVLYQVTATAVEVVAVVHAAQEFPAS